MNYFVMTVLAFNMVAFSVSKIFLVSLDGQVAETETNAVNIDDKKSMNNDKERSESENKNNKYGWDYKVQKENIGTKQLSTKEIIKKSPKMANELPTRDQTIKFHQYSFSSNEILGDSSTYDMTAHHSNHLEYAGKKGTEYWGKNNPRCVGSKQSPINLDTTLSRRCCGRRIEMRGYNEFTEYTKLENNGHSVQLTVKNNSSSARMSGGHLKSWYKLDQLHFHWAAVDTVGSEHTIDRVHFPLEMHLVHTSMTIRNKQEQGHLAVAGFFFQISRYDNPDIEPIIERIGRIKRAHKRTELQRPFNLKSLIRPSLSGPYYSYEGSLTTPPCTEVVEWILFKKPLDISSRQLAKFRTVRDPMGKAIKFNFRPVQPLYHRKIKLHL